MSVCGGKRDAELRAAGIAPTFAARNSDAAAHALRQLARLERSNAEAAWFRRDEGLEQFVAQEGGRHATAVIDHGDRHVCAVCRDDDPDRIDRGAGLDRVL